MITRDHTRTVSIGDRVIGGGNPVLIQSMTNTPTADVKATVEQIRRLDSALDPFRATLKVKDRYNIENRSYVPVSIAEVKKILLEK